MSVPVNHVWMEASVLIEKDDLNVCVHQDSKAWFAPVVRMINRIETLRFLCLNLRSHLAMQRPSSEATTSCPNRDAPALPDRDQRAVILFF